MLKLDYDPYSLPNDFKGETIACAFHAHSDIGSVDGASTVEKMVKRMSDLGMTHVTFTEHGTLNSAAAIYRTVTTKFPHMKVIHAVEGYIFWPGDTKTSHINIFFKTKQAFEAYCKLTPLLFSPPRVQNKGGDYKACMYWEDLEELAKHGIVVGTACIGGWLNRPIANQGDIEEAKKRLDKMIELVGIENIYDEFIVDDLSKDWNKETREFDEAPIRDWFSHPCIGREANRIRWEEVCKPRGVRRVASQDAHYAIPEEKIVHDNKRWAWNLLMGFHQHLKGAGEYAHLAKKNQALEDHDIVELIRNTHEFVKNFDHYEFHTYKERGFMIPKFDGNAEDEIYRRIEEKGVADLSKPEVKERVETEIDVLASNKDLDGLSYLLLVDDIAKLAQNNGDITNVRGSAGGCYTAYAIGLHPIDSLKYDLQFERFLTRGRIAAGTPPDIDLDFGYKDRAIKLLQEKYGDHYLIMSIDTLLKPKSAIKDSERAILGKVRAETERMCVDMENPPQGMSGYEWLFGTTDKEGEHIPGEFEKNETLQRYAKNNPEIWSSVSNMCGIMRQKGTHASGVVVASEPVQNFIPVCRVGKSPGVLATGYGPKDVEYVGGMKVDILGVNKMAVIQETLTLIKERHGVEYEWGHFPEEADVFTSVYHTGETEGTFQTSTVGIKGLCKNVKPNTISEVSNLIALYRPSCLDAPPPAGNHKNMVEYYVAAAKKEQEPVYIHQDLEAIYGVTLGTSLFQEQHLRTFRDIAGYSYEQAETVRRGIGKKDIKILDSCMKDLRDGCLSKGWDILQAEQLIDTIMASARYCFNKSHSISYAIFSYHTAFLKYKFPLEFWCAELTVETAKSDNEKRLSEYGISLKNLIEPPKVGTSHPTKWIISENGKLVTPLSALKGCGEKFVMSLDMFYRVKELAELGEPEKGTKKKKRVNTKDIYDDLD